MEQSNVAFIILKTGPRIVAEVHLSDEPDLIYMVNPMELVVFDDVMTGQTGFTFKEWVPRAIVMDRNFPMNLSDTYGIMKPTPMMETFYNKIMKKKIAKGKEKLISGDPEDAIDEADPLTEAISDALYNADNGGDEKSEVYEYILRNLNPEDFTIN